MNLLKKLLLAGAAICAASTLILSCGGSGQKEQAEPSDVSVLKSPDGKLSMTFTIAPDGSPTYSLSYGETTILRPSHLGYEMRGVLKAGKLVFGDKGIRKEDGKPCWSFHDGFKVESVDTCSFDETWSPVWGEESEIRNHYNELAVNLVQTATEG